MSKKGFFESKNPAMNEKTFRKIAQTVEYDGPAMTVQGAINKSFILLGIMLLTSVLSFTSANPLYIWGGAILGLIIVVVASFKPHLSPTLAPLYAGVEGLFVGGITAMYAGLYAGIVFQAVTLTIAILFMMLFIYKTGIIKVTNKFRTGVVMATGGVLIVYLLSWVLRMFGIHMPYLHSGGMMGIGISLVIIGIASLNLLLDFDNFEKGEQYGLPNYMEWFSAMGLLITLVWLYVEILRLLAILSDR